MPSVEPLHVGPEFSTDVFAATNEVIVAMTKLAKRKHDSVIRFRKLIDRCARRGFRSMPGTVIRPEGNAVYAIGDRRGPLLRVAGFYDDNVAKQTFVLAHFYEKTKGKLKSNERDLIAKVARIKKDGTWRVEES